MPITITNISKYTEDLRAHLLGLLFGGPDQGDEPNNMTYGYAGVAHAFDRATVKSLLANVGTETSAQIAELKAPADGSVHGKLNASAKKRGGPKPGSKAAKERALKAGETRRANKAAKEAQTVADGVAQTGTVANVGAAATNRPATGFGGTPFGSGGAV